MKFQLKKLPPYRIAYMRQVGPYGEKSQRLMDNFKKWVKHMNLETSDSIILGIAQDPPDTLPEKCRYDACLVVSEHFIFTDDTVFETRLPGETYAIFTVSHTATAIEKAWREIFTILSNNGHQVDFSRPLFERYIKSLLDKHVSEICIPVLDTL